MIWSILCFQKAIPVFNNTCLQVHRDACPIVYIATTVDKDLCEILTTAYLGPFFNYPVPICL